MAGKTYRIVLELNPGTTEQEAVDLGIRIRATLSWLPAERQQVRAVEVHEGSEAMPEGTTSA